jgi:PAS domain S-box-containing protein
MDDDIRKFRKTLWISIISWLLLVCVSFTWNSWQSWQSMLNQGRSEGKMAFLKDLSYRVWNASHGGIYVPITDDLKPNPYLKVPQRDVTTTTGKKLTLMNPAFMTRQVFTMSAERYSVMGHITSLNLLNPDNVPDAWEKKALLSFDKNSTEVTELTSINGKPFMRFMRPMITEDSCLKCHNAQGYQVGDLRGGISVSVPMTLLMSQAKKAIWYLALGHGAFLLFGILGILSSNRKSVQYFIASNESKKNIAKEKEQLSVTLRSIGDGVITTDIEGKIIFINKVAEQLTGWSNGDARGRPFPEVFNIINEKTGRKCTSPVSKVLVLGRIIALANHTALITKTGTQISIADSGAPIRDQKSKVIGVVIVFRDITHEKKIEEELVKIKKLECVGVLAGGIAHDFNNILSAILGNIELASYRVEKDDRTVSLLSEAQKATKRAAKLTQQLLTFSKGGDPIKEETSLIGLIRESADFVLHGSQVSCDYSFPDNLWMVNADSGQVGQVIQNITLNAKHAMPEGGKVKVSCRNVENAAAESLLNIHDERFVCIKIHDSGVGIPQEITDKIFDPYFTTKQEGSGLGLAICHSIINKHDGHITVQSIPGKGTTFTIYLPAVPYTTADTTAPNTLETKQVVKSARIMVMDDDELIRDVVQEQLSTLGHEAVLVVDGEQAINKYQELQDSDMPIDLVIMDLTIPGGMGGQEAARKLLQITPEAKIIVASGYSNDPVMANYRKHGFHAAIAKPFDLEELRNGIETALT